MSDDALPTAGEVRALAARLLGWADRLAVGRGIRTNGAEDRTHEELILEVAHTAREFGRLRASFLRGPFGDPLWDVLLDLFVKEANGYRVTLDQLLAGSELPAEKVTWSVDRLGVLGLVQCNTAGLQSWVSLSPEAKEAMNHLMLEWAEIIGSRSETTPT